MKIQAFRTAAWACVCGLALTALSCDALNPALVGQLGGDASTVGVEPTGSILLVLNNQTGKAATLVYDVESNLPGGAQTVTQSGNMLTTGTRGAMTFDCNTTAIILTGITGPVTTTQTSDDTDVTPLAVNEFRRPALQCGSVIFVNVPVIGSPTADLLP